ncbi:MAG: DUF1559 domain-containing protein [Pirellulales bacterium]
MESYATGPTVDMISVPTLAMVFGVTAPAVSRARLQAVEAAETVNMRQLGVALMQYENEHGKLPKNIVDENGNPLLSWRVAVLPYLEQQWLYEQFHLDEPWDSEHNKPLLARIPPPFVHSAVEQKPNEGLTIYQYPTGAVHFLLMCAMLAAKTRRSIPTWRRCCSPWTSRTPYRGRSPPT